MNPFYYGILGNLVLKVAVIVALAATAVTLWRVLT